MSHQLKLNALHFSKSLEDEKAIIESSQGVLESAYPSLRHSEPIVHSSNRCFARQPGQNPGIEIETGKSVLQITEHDVVDIHLDHRGDDRLGVDISLDPIHLIAISNVWSRRRGCRASDSDWREDGIYVYDPNNE